MSAEMLVINATASGDNTIKAGVAGKAIIVLSLVVIANGDNTITWKSGSTAVSGPMTTIAASGYAEAANAGPPGNMLQNAILVCGVGENLILNLAAAGVVGGHGTFQYAGV